MSKIYDYVIVGAGIAGFKAAEAIRQYDGEGSLLLINGEDRLPYKRTRISKNLHAGFLFDQFALAGQNYFEAKQITLLNERLLSIELPKKQLTTIRKKKFGFQKLIFATGAVAKPPMLRGNGKKNIFLLRTAADAQSIMSNSRPIEKIVVSGGGVQGIEIAEQLVKNGKQITLVHRETQLMNKHLDSYLSGYLHQLLEQNGIVVICNEEVRSISKTGNDKQLLQVGEIIQLIADMTIFSIGSEPDIALATAAGIKTNKGIVVNNRMQCSHPDVFAAGDVAEHPDGTITGLWHAAEMQGTIAGANATGQQVIYTQPPFRLKMEVFDQYFFSMNMPRIANGHESVVIEKMPVYYHFYFKQNKLQGMLMLNKKDLAKSCETAVREHWDKEKVLEYFS